MKGNLLDRLPPVEGKVVELVQSQDIGDIIEGVLDKHIETTRDYDLICDRFHSSDEMSIFKKLFGYCKKNLPYKEEGVDVQTVRTPAATIALGSLWGVDCKHYAGFIAGVLDALNRKYDLGIDWCYRFASYSMFKKSPGHVFIVIDPGTNNEIWIDPVLKSFNIKSPYPTYVTDKRIDNMLVSISGIEKQYANPFAGESGAAVGSLYIVENPFAGESGYAVGTTQDVGALLMKVSPVVSTVPVIGWAASAVTAISGVLLKLFSGTRYTEGGGVIQLIKRFQFKVLGDTAVYSGGEANESLRDQARSWFSMVLGVPVGSWDDVLVLLGFFGSYGSNMTRTEYLPVSATSNLSSSMPSYYASGSQFTFPTSSSTALSEAKIDEYYRPKNTPEVITAYRLLHPELTISDEAITAANRRAFSLLVTNTPGGVSYFSQGWNKIEDYLVSDQGAWGNKYPGVWKDYTVAPLLVSSTNPDLVSDQDNLTSNNTNMALFNTGLATTQTSTATDLNADGSAIKAGLGANMVPLLLLGGALVFGLAGGKSKKVGAANNTNTLLLVGGLGLAAVLLLTRKSGSDATTDLLRQQQQQLSALQLSQQNNQTATQTKSNVWTALPSILDTAKDIFNW